MTDSKTLADNFAVSLEYEGSGAPKVTAKGKGYIAQEIIETAKAHNIPIQQDPELINLLSQVELNQEIPEALYEAVAQVLIFAYQVSGKSPLESQSQASNPPTEKNVQTSSKKDRI